MIAERPARTRILETAANLFYQQGLRAVGIDEIVARSGVAKTTLYAHFQSKDLLIAAYLQRNSYGLHRIFEEALVAFTGTPEGAFDHVFAMIAESCASPTFRGCPYINFAVEFPDRSHPGWDVCQEHRRWLHGLFARLASDEEMHDPEGLAGQLCLLYDAAMVGSMIDGTGRSAARARETAASLVSVAIPQ